MSNILYVMEAGRGQGHLIAMRRIVEALALTHKVYLVSVNAIDQRLLPTSVTYFNIPKEDQLYPFAKVQTLDARYLIQGMGDIGTITRMCSFYRSLVSKYRIDAIVADFAPFAHLMAYAKNIPIVTVQSAYAMPPKSPYLRGLVPGSQIRLADSNKIRDAVNTYLATQNKPAIADVSDIYTHGKHLTTSYREMDHFSIVTDTVRDLEYIGPIPSSVSTTFPDWRQDGVVNVVIYSDHDKRLIPSIITMLLLVDNANVVLISDDAYIVSQLEVDLQSRVRFERSPLAKLADYIAGADIVICNGNEATVADSIKRGVPVIAIPVHPNQKVIGDWLAENHLGVVIDSGDDVTPQIDEITNSLLTYSENCIAYADAHLHDEMDQIIAVLTAVSESI